MRTVLGAMTNHNLHDLQLSLSSARAELSPLKARDAFRRIIKDSKALYDGEGNLSEAVVLAASAMSDLAALEVKPDRRLQLRRDAIKALKQCLRSTKSVSLLINYANRIVDHFYDANAREESRVIANLLAEAATLLKHAIADLSNDTAARTQALIQRASVLRCQALIAGPAERMSRVQEAIRCAEKAVANSGDQYAYLELGQAWWASARWTINDEAYFAALQNAEGALLSARRNEEPIAHLVLARFYRQSYRPAQSVDAFAEYQLCETSNIRRLLAEAFLLGEAALQLWYNKYEHSFVTSSLENAFLTVTQSVDAGYETARNLSALAFVQATLGRTESAEMTLRRLSPESVDSWISIISQVETAVETGDMAALKQAFAIGIDEGSMWNALGTYATRFLQDDFLAIRLYKVGKKLEPRNPVILTNMARTYIRVGGNENLSAADELLRLAASCAPRSFVWWRALREDLRNLSDSSKAQPVEGPSISGPLSFRGLQQRYKALTVGVSNETIDAQQRGYLIQQLVQDLITLSFWSGEVSASHQVHHRQVDAAFTYRGVRHRVEVKWKAGLLHQDDIDAMPRILEQAEVRGVIISMSGYSAEAVEYAREMGRHHAVLLVNNQEMDHVFAGRIRFEALIEWKLVHWRANGNPYVTWLPDIDQG